MKTNGQGKSVHILTRAGLLIIAGICAGPQLARAQACTTCSVNGAARVSIDSSTPTPANNNAGVLLRSGGAAQWSLALVGAPGSASAYFTIWNEQVARDALRIQLGGAGANTLTHYGDILPDSGGIRKLGSAQKMYSQVWANDIIELSDRTLKTDIKPLATSLDSVLKLRPVSFKWKKAPSGREHLGLIAQEVREVLPLIVETEDEPNSPLGITYNELTPVLIRAIQEQQAIIQRQSERLTALEKVKSSHAALGSFEGGALLASIPLAFAALWQKRRRRSTPKQI